MQELNNNKVGLIVGSFMGLWHLTWSLLVAVGVAQTLLNWVFDLHFLDNPYHVMGFRMGTAILLILVTSVLGYVFGWALAFLWNVYHKKLGP